MTVTVACEPAVRLGGPALEPQSRNGSGPHCRDDERSREFKRKLGGRRGQLLPTLDYVYDAAAYVQFRIAARGTRMPPEA
jgi:hypothetical protein